MSRIVIWKRNTADLTISLHKAPSSPENTNTRDGGRHENLCREAEFTADSKCVLCGRVTKECHIVRVGKGMPVWM